jgi:hypothetical protein
MSEDSVVDSTALVSDLRLASAYASRAGLLSDRTLLDSLEAAEKTIKNDKDPDIFILTIALNAITKTISPMTLADLRGKDPFSPENQRTSQHVQLALSIFSLLLLLVIGFFMQALHREQEVLVALSNIQEMHPELKLNALRKMAQYDEPMLKQNTLYDEYHQSLSELRLMNAKLNDTYTNAVEVKDIPLFPFGQYFRHENAVPAGYPAASPQTVRKTDELASNATGGGMQASTTDLNSLQSAPSSPAQPATMSNTTLNATSNGSQSVANVSEFCEAGYDGNINLPKEYLVYPDWMKALLSDTLGDFCFQLKVLSPAGDGALLNTGLTQLAFVSDIREKVAVRVAWFLPFFYGLLGSAVFLMRNVANVRTPVMEWFPIIMRISLGGVAGIVIVWFSSSTTPGLETVGSLSVPFAAAFLTGYGIDVLFTLLDRLNRAIGDIPKS